VVKPQALLRSRRELEGGGLRALFVSFCCSVNGLIAERIFGGLCEFILR
jgi:hypothetical protein